MKGKHPSFGKGFLVAMGTPDRIVAAWQWKPAGVFCFFPRVPRNIWEWPP